LPYVYSTFDAIDSDNSLNIKSRIISHLREFAKNEPLRLTLALENPDHALLKEIIDEVRQSKSNIPAHIGGFPANKTLISICRFCYQLQIKVPFRYSKDQDNKANTAFALHLFTLGIHETKKILGKPPGISDEDIKSLRETFTSKNLTEKLVIEFAMKMLT